METYYNKSVIISRKPGKKKEGRWTLQVALFDENNPHLKGKVPFRVIELKEVEKVRIRDLRNISFYLVGNDLVINDLKSLNIDLNQGIVTLTGKQELSMD